VVFFRLFYPLLSSFDFDPIVKKRQISSLK
jgi:hypothetical protein